MDENNNNGWPAIWQTEKITKYIKNVPNEKSEVEKGCSKAIKQAFKDLGISVSVQKGLVFTNLAEATRILTMLGAFNDKNTPKKGSTLRLIGFKPKNNDEMDEK